MRIFHTYLFVTNEVSKKKAFQLKITFMLKLKALDNKMDVFTINDKDSGWLSLDVNGPCSGVFLVKFNHINIDTMFLLLTLIMNLHAGIYQGLK